MVACALLLAFPLATGQDAVVDAAVVAVLPIRVVVYDYVEDSTYSCDAVDLSERGLEICASIEDALRVPMSSDTPIGWREGWSDRDTSSETCGYYRAQLGHVVCTIPFQGYRRINSLWTYHYGGTDAEYLTTGSIHNYWLEQNNGIYQTFKDNRQYGAGAPQCWGGFGDGGKGSGVDGGIQPHERKDACELWAVSGTWGIGVNYDRAWGEKGVKYHSYVYQYG